MCKDSTDIPKLLTKSSLVIPIPVYRIVNVLLAVSGIISIFKFGSLPNASLSFNDSHLVLSNASDEFEIKSRENISLFSVFAASCSFDVK